MSKLFEESDSESEIQTNNNYAKNYDNWRKKEELNKLKTRYGEELEESSSSSDDDDVEIDAEIDKQFLRTLSCLKNKDPRIYDENIRFFEEAAPQEKKKKTKEKSMFVGDYERELILKNNLDEEEEGEENPRAHSPTYVEEQKQLKDSFKNVLDSIEDEETEEWGGMLKVREKSQPEKEAEEAEYIKWLAGQQDKIEDKETESDLKPLKEYWNDPNLDQGERFLRDYILKKKFLSQEDPDYIPTYEEVVHDSDSDLDGDETAIEKQEQFEHKYNFRFEEPDQDFIKRFPRTMEQSLRKTDDRRKLKRAETKERKQMEKTQKMQELKKLQELKRKEIEEKIEKLKEITGNTDIRFQEDDLEEDFDPDAHDRKMESLFNEEFYQGDAENEKPEFPEMDEFLEIEDWSKWEPEDPEHHEPHCEDEDFNMDADYDPQASTSQELIENSKGKKKRKRKSLFAKAVSKPKPIFDPKDKSYAEYIDEYYKLDCEDIIGDIPCRFKYRKVVPNDFGLTVEEILMAKDRELNKWCSLKKAMQHRSENVERYDQIAYARKASNLELKKRILPSLFQEEPEQTTQNVNDVEPNIGKGKKRKIEQHSSETDVKRAKTESQVVATTDYDEKKKKKKQIIDNLEGDQSQDNVNKEEGSTSTSEKLVKKKKANGALQNAQDTGNKKELTGSTDGNGIIKKKKSLKKGDKKKNHMKGAKNDSAQTGISDARLSAYGINPKKFKNKMKFKKNKQ